MAKYVEFFKQMANYKKAKRIKRVLKEPPEGSLARRKIKMAKLMSKLNKGYLLNEADDAFLMEMKTIDPTWAKKAKQRSDFNMNAVAFVQRLSRPYFFDREDYMHEYTPEELKILLEDEKKKRNTRAAHLEQYRKEYGFTWLTRNKT